MEDWVSLETLGFPDYELSDMGRVRNTRSRRLLKMSANQEGIVRVGLMRREEGRQVTVSVVRLVARMFVPGRSEPFDTPIQLNGDRADLRASNIMWRPRGFAVKYFWERDRLSKPVMGAEIYEVKTGHCYHDSRDAATKLGLLEADVAESVSHGSPCFPTWSIFALLEH